LSSTGALKALGESLALHVGHGMSGAPHVHGRDALDELAVSLEIIASISVNWNQCGGFQTLMWKC
jgi:hypothetical protein